ncbi:MAG: relaxase domain-containing protein, partial [Gemmatimonadetes bacterium]|nr:relaxase domain-containing protein [Gemmatimonadota bacterium]
MLPGRITKVPISDEGAYIEYLANRASGREDQVAYLSEAGRAPSRWMGSGAAVLGLAGAVDLGVLRAYAECRDPATGEQLGLRLPKWGAFESPFTAPKDTSTLWALWVAMRGEIEESVWYGATAGIGRAEAEGAKYGRGSIRGEDVVYDSKGLIVGGFLHGSARAAGDYLPDPHLHCHAYAVNRVFCLDGKWRSMHSDPFVRASRTAVRG